MSYTTYCFSTESDCPFATNFYSSSSPRGYASETVKDIIKFQEYCTTHMAKQISRSPESGMRIR